MMTSRPTQAAILFRAKAQKPMIRDTRDSATKVILADQMARGRESRLFITCTIPQTMEWAAESLSKFCKMLTWLDLLYMPQTSIIYLRKSLERAKIRLTN